MEGCPTRTVRITPSPATMVPPAATGKLAPRRAPAASRDIRGVAQWDKDPAQVAAPRAEDIAALLFGEKSSVGTAPECQL
jgi:hypothetical protein